MTLSHEVLCEQAVVSIDDVLLGFGFQGGQKIMV